MPCAAAIAVSRTEGQNCSLPLCVTEGTVVSFRLEDTGRYECFALVTTGENKKQHVMCYIDLNVTKLSPEEKQTQDNDKGQDHSQGLDVVVVVEWEWFWVVVLPSVLLICAFCKRNINLWQQISKQPNTPLTSENPLS
uniref:Uncharacterized protein n=1 Tax=Knipowitschia caucasica TaxID=637954 RepID=A0AAV2KSJ4_KNICA